MYIYIYIYTYAHTHICVYHVDFISISQTSIDIYHKHPSTKSPLVESAVIWHQLSNLPSGNLTVGY